MYQRLKYAGSGVFSVERPALQRLLGIIAADRRNRQYKNQFARASSICRFRSRHRELNYGRSEYKDMAKLAAENYTRAQTFKEALEQIANAHPGISNDPMRLWNLDETVVNTDFCQCGTQVRTTRSGNSGGSVVNSPDREVCPLEWLL